MAFRFLVIQDYSRHFRPLIADVLCTGSIQTNSSNPITSKDC